MELRGIKFSVLAFWLLVLIPGFKWTASLALVFGLVVIAITVPRIPAHKALSATIGAVIFMGIFAYHAASNETTGTAIWHNFFWARGTLVEALTQDTSPAKFRWATDSLWGGSGLFLWISMLSFKYYRKLQKEQSQRKAGSVLEK
jgi:hypothetical protein